MKRKARSGTLGADDEAAGDACMAQGQYERAVKAYAIALAVHSGDEAGLLVKRARGLMTLAKNVVSRPSSESDNDRLLGPESQTLASLAQHDLDRAIGSGDIPEGELADVYSLKGDSHFALDEYAAALDTYRQGLGYDPLHSDLLTSIRQTRKFTSTAQCQPSRHARKAPCSAAQAPAADNDALPPDGSKADGTRGKEGLLCGFCGKLLYDPVTTPSGHSFCRHCLQQALSKDLRCPVTQKVMHLNAKRHPVSVNLQSILLKAHATETLARSQEVAAEAGAIRQVHDVLPIFTLDYIVPGQTLALNMFEPRYRLMTRRCMDGDRKFGVIGVRNREASEHPLRDVGTEVEIVEAHQLFDGRCHIQVGSSGCAPSAHSIALF